MSSMDTKQILSGGHIRILLFKSDRVQNNIFNNIVLHQMLEKFKIQKCGKIFHFTGFFKIICAVAWLPSHEQLKSYDLAIDFHT
jgi:hypothetical protein